MMSKSMPTNLHGFDAYSEYSKFVHVNLNRGFVVNI